MSKPTTKDASASAGTLASFLSRGGGALGSARPVAQTASSAVAKDADDEASDYSEDERVLALRVARSEEHGGNNDWLEQFEPSDEEEESEEEESPPPPRAKAAAPARPAPASLSAAPVTSGAMTSAWRSSVVVTKERLVASKKRKREGVDANASTEPPVKAALAKNAKSAADAADTTASRTSAPDAPVAKRALPAAFMTSKPTACLFVRNLPLDASAASIRGILARFGDVRRVHLETNNSGRPAGFGYVEFETPAAAAAARATTGLTLDGRDLSLAAYTADANYRNADGSRKREKKARKE